jgi:hypothetical protein
MCLVFQSTSSNFKHIESSFEGVDMNRIAMFALVVAGTGTWSAPSVAELEPWPEPVGRWCSEDIILCGEDEFQEVTWFCPLWTSCCFMGIYDNLELCYVAFAGDCCPAS